IVAGSPPSVTATGSFWPSFFAFSKWAAPVLWRCQWRPTVLLSKRWTRYMPALRSPVSGSWVWTIVRVTKGPPSSGQQVCTGRRSRSTSSSRYTISWHGALLLVRGGNLEISRSRGNSWSFAMRPLPGPLVSSRRSSMRPPISLRSSTPSAFAMRFLEPKALMRSGWSLPWTLWKRRAGPVLFMTRSAISVISNFALTGSRTSTSSFSLRRTLTNSCRLFAVTLHLPYGGPDALLRALLVFTRDNTEELGQMRRPEREGDDASARNLAGPIPDHTARHPDKARLVEPRYGLYRQGVGVVADEDRIVRRRPGCVVRPEPLLQIPQGLGDSLSP